MRMQLKLIVKVSVLLLITLLPPIVKAEVEAWMQPYLCEDAQSCKPMPNCETEELSAKQCRLLKKEYERSKHRGAVSEVGEVRSIDSKKITNVERLLPDEEITSWSKFTEENESSNNTDVTQRVEVCKVQLRCIYKRKVGSVVKAQIRHAIKPLMVSEDRLGVPQSYLQSVANILQEYQEKDGLSLRFVGHTSNVPLSASERQQFASHKDLSEFIAQSVASSIQRSLALPSTMVVSAGKGGVKPIASNTSAQGRALNKRVELEVWYELKQTEKDLEPRVCPFAAEAEIVDMVYEDDKPIIYFKNGEAVYPIALESRIKRIMKSLQDKDNVRVHFIGHTSKASLSRRQAKIHPTHQQLSLSRAKKVVTTIKPYTGLRSIDLKTFGLGFSEPNKTANTIFDRIDLANLSRKARSDNKKPNPEAAVNERDDRVVIEFHYDEKAVLSDDNDFDITPIATNEEAVSPFALLPIRMSVDGESVSAKRIHRADMQRCTDVALDEASVKLSFDSNEISPKLQVEAVNTSVFTSDNANTQYKENTIEFVSYSNYENYIDNSEIRIYSSQQSQGSKPLVIAKLENNFVRINVSELGSNFSKLKQEYSYVLRAYDENGKFDETKPKSFWLINSSNVNFEPRTLAEAKASIYGFSNIASRNIKILGGTLIIAGREIPAEHFVWALDRSVPVSSNKKFVVEQIIPYGQHAVEVAVLNSEGAGNVFTRTLSLQKNNWFTVAIADLTVGKDNTNGPASLITNDDTHFNNEVFSDGRLAFYTKGETESGYKITASVDTGEASSEDLFSNFSDQNPDFLFRRLDQDEHYSSFGDESTLIEDAPTQGKFYARLEKNKSYALLGNFKTDLLSTDLSQVDRGLYGIHLHGETEKSTTAGEALHQFDLFVAAPGTLSARDEFRGTGGSVYFLNQRDITQGSERLRVEVRDKDSGLVISTKNLVPAQDYDIDYIQGRVILTTALSSIANDNLLVQSNSFNGHPVFLVSRYEYSAELNDLDNTAQGVRYSTWLNDSLKLGLTHSQENDDTGSRDVTLNGLDMMYQFASPSTYLKIESARSEGKSNDTLLSIDGGYNFNRISNSLTDSKSANSYRVEFAAKLNDLFDFESDKGHFSIYQQDREAGFAAPGQTTEYDSSQAGFYSSTPLNKRWKLITKFDSNKRKALLETDALEINAKYKHSKEWAYEFGIRSDSREDLSASVPVTQTQGRRTDLASKAIYRPDDKQWSVYTFAQTTLDNSETRDKNSRLGIGGEYLLNAKTSLNGEISGGDAGTGGQLGLDYKLSDSNRVYLSHRVDNERDISGVLSNKGNSTVGFTNRFSDSLSVYGEERYAFGDQAKGLTHAYGVDYITNNQWLVGSSFEIGELEEPESLDSIKRQALTFSAQRTAKNYDYRGVVELRNDETNGNTSDFTLFKNDGRIRLNANWEFLAKYYLSDNNNSLGSFYEGDFSELSLGYAYRPINNDKLNVLLKYTDFENRPTANQLNQGTLSNNALQKSEIFALDINYDITPRWTLGAKIAQREGQIALDRTNPVYTASNAELLIIRADWHVVRRWDLLLETRSLKVEQAQDQRKGNLIGLYRHFGDNLKAGIGYNYTDFSDDLTDLDFDSKGVFINVTGKL